MTLKWPVATDDIEELGDRKHALTGEDWSELEGALETIQANLGSLGQRWNGKYETLARILNELFRVDAGRRSANSSTWAYSGGAGGNTITFDAGVFDTAGDIAVVVGRVTDGAAAPDPDDGATPTEFGVFNVTTSGATIYGYRAGGADPTGTTSVTVAYMAFQRRRGRTQPLTTKLLTLDSFPGLVSGYDDALVDVPNQMAAAIEETCDAAGVSPEGSWTDVATALTAIEKALTGTVTAQAVDFAGVGLGVDVDDFFFAGQLTDIEILGRTQTDGADTTAGSNYPITFVGHRIQAIAGNKVRFFLRGFARGGGSPSGSDQIVVAYTIRRSAPAPS